MRAVKQWAVVKNGKLCIRGTSGSRAIFGTKPQAKAHAMHGHDEEVLRVVVMPLRDYSTRSSLRVQLENQRRQINELLEALDE